MKAGVELAELFPFFSSSTDTQRENACCVLGIILGARSFIVNTTGRLLLSWGLYLLRRIDDVHPITVFLSSKITPIVLTEKIA